MMRKIGEFMGKARRMANDFRASFEDMARQSELDDLRKQVEEMRSKATDPMGLNSTLAETEAEINQSLMDPSFDYGGAQTEHVPWEEPEAAAEEPAPKPVRKRAPRKVAGAETPIVEGGSKPKSPRKTTTRASASPARRSRSKTVT
jgi:sec-independent protein translocase protein TatB